MPKFRKKPVVIEAVRLPGRDNYDLAKFHAWRKEVGFTSYETRRDLTMIIPTLEGNHTAQPDDWIIKGVAGEFYPCKSDIFEATYELVEGA